jgi:uncharacterized membrane protein (UPF0136 family)
MNGMPTMHLVAAAATGLYGLVSITGGILGYMKGSTVSLVAGGIAGVLLILAAVGISRWPTASLIVALILALLLVGRFGMALLTRGEQLTTVLYNTSIVMVVGGVIVIVCSALAFTAGPRPPTTP